jgi:hypothetical protein
MNAGIGKTAWLVAISVFLASAGSVRTAEYVVDASAPGAADTNAGTEDKPWKTIQRAAGVAKAGDTVSVMEGNYPERVTLKNPGAEGKFVTFRCCPRRGAEVYGFATGKADYVRIEGFKIHAPTPSRPPGIEISSNHVEALDNYLYDLGSGIHPAGSGSDSPTDVRLAYNELYQVQEGIWVGGTKWVVEHNFIHRAKWWGVWGDADYTRPFGTDHVLRYNCLLGSKQAEIGKAHLDCFQYFDDGGGIGKRIEVSYNVLYDFHQMLMGEMTKTADSAGDWTFHHNIACSTSIGAWGICNMGIPRVKSLNNTFYGIQWYGVGCQGKTAEGCVVQNCIFQKIDQALKVKDATPQVDHNIFFQCGTKDATQKDRLNMDPRMAAPEKYNFRLQRGSPAIGAGEGNVSIGALEYPNVYYVDPRHPAATDDGFGYAGQPYKTLAKALEAAQAGETIVVREGVIRETLKANSDGVTVRAMKGEKVTISGADVIEGWKREKIEQEQKVPDVWSAPLAAEPTKVLRDGQPWSDFTYDKAGKKIVVKAGGDPRLHLIETVVRERGIDLGGKAAVKVEDITAVNTLK